ncbi:efflux transporter outer membrane subunit [Uliginosibacterium sp. TH139]|uniref:efflux transporter outer membrane subunit n=1 Tax=Uliginosibacterium sp. TH139 TaxID=2067453 RepID=UPI0026BA0276|nr:efflux transporter outer membrane subunit [Uliginosibacterium sp. TH139]
MSALKPLLNHAPRVLPLLLGLSLAACVNLAPQYERPAAPVPASLGGAAVSGSAALTASEVVDSDWQAVIVDARLRAVIRLALEQNRDLRVALANVDKARATYRVQRADQLPGLNGTASASREHTSKTASSSGQAATSSSFKAQLGISSFELDLFGRVQNLSEAALQTYLGLEETRRATRLSLVAEVATAWLTLAADQQQLALAQATLASRERSLSLMQQAKALGGESGPNLASARASREAARASVASYASSVGQDRTALELLVGTRLGEELLPPAGTGEEAERAAQLLSVPAELSSEVLLRRPDVLAAEHTLRADNANIGAARAAFFPSISLTAAGGSSSRALGDLFSSGSGAWSFAPAISLPIFDAGANRATLDARKAQQAADIASYEKAIQTAFAEVADALTVRSHVAEQLDAQREYVAASQQALDFATELYRQGSGSYLDVLVAQRALFTAQQSLISLRLAEQSNRITLFKVLGGGSAESGGAAG